MEPRVVKISDEITIIHGDCRDVFQIIEPVDLGLTDPPYGIKMDKGFCGFCGFGGFGKPIMRRRYETDNWDQERPDKKTFESFLSKCKKAIIFGGNFFADILPRSTHWIFWDKLQTMPTFGDGEIAWTNVNRKSIKKIVIEYNGLIGKENNRFHPTQKPLKLMNWCIINYSEKSQIILDPFAGSFTTGVACIRTGRRFIGIEIDEKYFDIGRKRLERELSQPRFDFDKTEFKQENKQGILL